MVWRRLQVHSDTSLTQLHEVLQIAMGWENYHLHAFESGGERYGSGGNGSPEDISLGLVLPAIGDTMIYQYDFGDDWLHFVQVEKILTRTQAALPRCTAGRRTCPPEDVGGPPGFDDMLRALRARKGYRYHEIKEWLGTSRFDVDGFDLAAVNARLAKLSPEPD